MLMTDSLQLAIQQELTRVYLCTLDELVGLLPQFPPHQVVAMVERLTLEGAIACRTSDPSRMILWLPPMRSSKRHPDESLTNNTLKNLYPWRAYEPADANLASPLSPNG